MRLRWRIICKTADGFWRRLGWCFSGPPGTPPAHRDTTAMNGAQLLMAQGDYLWLMGGPPAGGIQDGEPSTRIPLKIIGPPCEACNSILRAMELQEGAERGNDSYREWESIWMAFAVAEDAVTKAFQNIGNEWALLTAGDVKRFNTMTISWGTLGFIWQRPVVTVLVRPPRYTHEFVEEFESFSVSFYERKYRAALSILGTKSGRDTDKVGLSGLTPAFVEGVPTFKEAYLTVVARKIYRGRLESAGFLVPPVDVEFYPEKDYHTVYFAELVKTVGRQ